MQWLAPQLFAVPLCKPAHKTKSSVYIYIYLIHHQPYQLPDLPKSGPTNICAHLKSANRDAGTKSDSQNSWVICSQFKKKILVQDVPSKAIAAISCAPYPQVLFWVLVWQPQSDVPVHRQQPSLRDKPFPMEWEKKTGISQLPLITNLSLREVSRNTSQTCITTSEPNTIQFPSSPPFQPEL